MQNRHDAIKLIDFGVSHHGQIGGYDITGMAGTGHFMAPETFGRQTYYGCEIDIWSLGIMTYVMLFGSYPFDAPFLSQIEDKILLGKYTFPPDLEHHVSANARSFIQQLLQYKHKARPLAVELVEHPWLRRNGAATNPFSEFHHSKLRQYIRAREPSSPLRVQAEENAHAKENDQVNIAGIESNQLEGFKKIT